MVLMMFCVWAQCDCSVDVYVSKKRIVITSILSPEDGDRTFLLNTGVYQSVHTVLKLRKNMVVNATAFETSNHK